MVIIMMSNHGYKITATAISLLDSSTSILKSFSKNNKYLVSYCEPYIKRDDCNQLTQI